MALRVSSYFKLNIDPAVGLLESAEQLLIGYPEPTDIFFFYKPLLDQHVGGKSAFYRLKCPSHVATSTPKLDIALLRFFQGYREVDILVISQDFVENIPLNKAALNECHEISWQYAQAMCDFQHEAVTNLRRYSCWVNESFPPEQIDSFAEVFLGDHTIGSVDGPIACTEKGFLFKIVEPYHYALYERYLLMYGLLLAYQISLELFINELAFFTIENVISLEQLRKECAQFNAIFYFTNPIKPGNSNLRPSWNKLMRPFNMETLTAEVLDQLEAITQIHQIEHEREQREKDRIEELQRRSREEELQKQEGVKQRRQNVFNLWLSVVGVLLTSLTVIQIKPSDVANFIHEWGKFFTHLV